MGHRYNMGIVPNDHALIIKVRKSDQSVVEMHYTFWDESYPEWRTKSLNDLVGPDFEIIVKRLVIKE